MNRAYPIIAVVVFIAFLLALLVRANRLDDAISENCVVDPDAEITCISHTSGESRGGAPDGPRRRPVHATSRPGRRRP